MNSSSTFSSVMNRLCPGVERPSVGSSQKRRTWVGTGTRA